VAVAVGGFDDAPPRGHGSTCCLDVLAADDDRHPLEALAIEVALPRESVQRVAVALDLVAV